MKSLLATLIATSFVGVTAHADVHIKPPARGPVDTTIGTNPPKPGQPGGKTGIGRFEQREKAKRLVEAAAKNSDLNNAMKEDQPNDLKRLKATLVKAVLADKDAKEIVYNIASEELPTNAQQREEVQFDMQMTLTLLAGQYGYQEQDN